MTAERNEDAVPATPEGRTCVHGSCPEAVAWREVARALFAACSFDEFDSLYEVHAGEMQEAAERFRRLEKGSTGSV